MGIAAAVAARRENLTIIASGSVQLVPSTWGVKHPTFPLYGARGQGCSLPLVFFLASKAPSWTRRPRLRLGLKTFKLFWYEINTNLFFTTPPKKKKKKKKKKS